TFRSRVRAGTRPSNRSERDLFSRRARSRNGRIEAAAGGSCPTVAALAVAEDSEASCAEAIEAQSESRAKARNPFIALFLIGCGPSALGGDDRPRTSSSRAERDRRQPLEIGEKSPKPRRRTARLHASLTGKPLSRCQRWSVPSRQTPFLPFSALA